VNSTTANSNVDAVPVAIFIQGDAPSYPGWDDPVNDRGPTRPVRFPDDEVKPSDN
jgi:hypothetical protein